VPFHYAINFEFQFEDLRVGEHQWIGAIPQTIIWI